uniref:Large ribosomal subunit protein uL10m n=1 Tax=Dermatophagoides pteronyssinus TaxID=6956 RepID=A0A6P6YB05_DERPT|nr:39S ribosomal protein L10, mitochondrial-like [Dermatophagoides pteronyssinus]
MSVIKLLNNCCLNEILANNGRRQGQVLMNWSQLRYRRSVAFREYRQPHFKQKLLLSICEPVFARQTQLPTSEKCGNLREKPLVVDHPYDQLLAADMSEELKQSKLVCLFHQNQMTRPDKRLLSNEFEHEGMFLRYYNRDIARICLQNTPYQPLLHFAIGYPFTILFAPNLEKIDQIFKIIRKYPQVILLGSLVEHRRLITNNQLKELAQLGNNLDQQRSILSNTLMLGQQQFISTLTHHSSQLKQLLNSHHQQLQENHDNNNNKSTEKQNDSS